MYLINEILQWIAIGWLIWAVNNLGRVVKVNLSTMGDIFKIVKNNSKIIEYERKKTTK